jgi:NADH:ubiquinone oxidoreductase subunit 5 (subunit L)/multisubunit Na+/H+ antiporter MnhA subunit
MMFFSSKWGFDFLYNNLLIRFFYRLIFDFYYFIDKGIIEFFGPTGGFKIVSTFSNNVVPKIQTGSLTNYLQYIAGCVFGLILVVPFLFG